MAIDKIVPKYLNKEDDVRLVKNVEMTDALNVRISADMTGDGGVIKNSYGNEAVSFASGVNWQDKTHALPSGTNKVVGSVADLKDGIVIFFVWNANGDHSIYRFSTASDVAELVYRDSVLEFQANSFVKGDVIRNLSQDSLLYFTDGISSPKKINVSRAIRGGYSGVLNTGSDSEKLEFITLAKKPPLDPPTFSFYTDSTIQENNIYESTYQFAYRYVYLDGEVSAISKYSELAVSQQQLRDGLISDEQKLENNAIRVSVLTSVADVRRIEVLARNGNTGAWFIIGEISNPSLSSSATLYVDFKNDELYRFISATDSDKLYDAVPLTAQSQTISGGRLFLGNYTEGYPNVNVKASLWANYNEENQVYDIPVNLKIETVDGYDSVSGFSLDLSSLSSITTTADSLLNVDLALDLKNISLGISGSFISWTELDEDLVEHAAGGILLSPLNLLITPISVSEYVNIPAGSNVNDIAAEIANTISKTFSVSFDSDITDQDYGLAFDPFETKIIGKTAILRWGFFRGSGSVLIQDAGINASYEQQFSISFPSITLSLKNVCGGSIAGINIQRIFQLAESGTISLTGGNGALYSRYGATKKETDGDEEYITYANQLSDGNIDLWNGQKWERDLIGGDFVQTAEVIYNSTFFTEDILSYRQFKSGASHDFGIVFYDDRNRASSVQKLGKAYIDWFSDRNYKGNSSVVMRIESALNAPSWARRWSPVYAKKGSIDSFIQYSVISGYYANNPVAIQSQYNPSTNDVIYLSFRSLEGKEDSYKEGLGANLEYSFVEGDRLRVISYVDETTYKFTVTGVVGNIAVGQSFLQISLPPTIFNITNIDLSGGTGYIYASGSGDPLASGTIFDPTTGAQIIYSAFEKVSDKIYPTEIDFEVVGYENLTDDANSNPILNQTNDDTIYNTTGWFLRLKDQNISGFSKNSIVSGTDNWSSKCIVEIYRKRKSAQNEVYYEIGRSYDVNSNGVMAGDRTSVPQVGAYCLNERPLQFYSTVILYAGDVISDGSGNQFLVTNVIESQNTVAGTDYYYLVDCTIQTGLFSAGDTFVVGVNPLNITNSTECVVQLDEGDTYYRMRRMRYGSEPNTFNYLVDYIESEEVSDFFTSSNTSIGRPFTVLPDAKTIYRTGSVTYSDPFLIDVQTNGLSSFNPTLANFYDLNYIHGSVRYLHNRDDSVVFLQDKKCGLFPVNRNLVQYSDGGQNLTVSTDVVGTPQYYQGEFGVNDNPESVAIEDGRIYFADIRSGKVIRISRDGITPISEQGMDAYFKDQFADIVSTASVKRVIGGIDDEAGEYIVSGPPVYTSTITITADGSDITTAYQLRVTDDGGTYEAGACFDAAIEELLGDAYATYTLQVAPDGSVIYGGIEYNDEVVFKVDTEYRNFNKICDTFDNSLNAVIFLDRLADGQPIYIGEEYIGTTPTTLYGIATNSTYDFFVMVTIDVARGTFVFDNSCGDYDGSIGTASETLSGFTTAYNTDSSVWNTRYSYNPENITCIDDVLYTFKNGTMYKHHDGVNRATYYGSADGSVVEVVAAFNPSMVKSYEAISLEGTAAWDTTITNTDQSSSIADTDYEQRERNWYAYIPRDSSANTGTTTITSLSGSSEIFALGAVSSVSGSDIVFTSDISYITFPIGASLYKVSGSTLVSITNTIASVSNGTTITCASAVTGVSAADEIVAIANGAIEGDQMRDYYAQIRLTNDSTSEVELYAVNAVFAKSNLANQLGQ
jgi:hypothetical protein